MAEFKLVRWNEVREKVSVANKEMCSLLDNIAPVLTPKYLDLVYVAKYHYGESVITSGTFTPPLGVSEREKNEFINRTQYAQLPLAMVTENSIQVYINTGDANHRTIPLDLLRAGELCGVFELLNSLSTTRKNIVNWEASAGARSAYLCARFKGPKAHKLLSEVLGKRNSLDWDAIDRDSWHLLKEVAYGCARQWMTEVIIFPVEWIIGDTVDHLRIQNYLYSIGWDQSDFLRNNTISDAQLEFLPESIKVSPWYLSHVKQILAIARGEALLFKPILSENEEYGPFQTCQKFLVEIDAEVEQHPKKPITQVLPYFPLILQPGYLDYPGDWGFYSASIPSILPNFPPVKSWVEDFHKELIQKPFREKLEKSCANLGIPSFKLMNYGKLQDEPGTAMHYKHIDKDMRTELPVPDGKKIDYTNPFFVASVKITLPSQPKSV